MVGVFDMKIGILFKGKRTLLNGFVGQSTLIMKHKQILLVLETRNRKNVNMELNMVYCKSTFEIEKVFRTFRFH